MPVAASKYCCGRCLWPELTCRGVRGPVKGRVKVELGDGRVGNSYRYSYEDLIGLW